jgi:hypothetical protein
MHNHPKLMFAALAALVSLVSGCSTPRHTDLLVFATNTEFGISVKGDSTSTAGVSIGYYRQEVVLMPLYVNASDSKVPPPTSPIAGAKYVGTDDEIRQDTYSVLASFGAKGAASTNNGGGVTIAQYFATGLAARTLALAGGALVTTSDKAAANPISADAISAEKATLLDEAAKKWHVLIDKIVAKIADPQSGAVDQAKLIKAFAGIRGAPDAAGLAQITTDTDLITELNQPQYRSKLENILKNVSTP